MARLPRVYHADLRGAPGETFDLCREEAHHLQRVLRVGAGEAVGVFDGRGSEWRATVVSSEGRGVRLRLERAIEGSVDPPLEVDLFQGLCKPERMDWVVQKATEVGVSAVRPVATDRSGPYALTERRLTRWRRVAVEACKQCGRRRLPELTPCGSLPRPPTEEVLAILLDPAPGATALANLLGDAPADSVWIAVGPEGGFERGEVEAALATGWRRAGLGPRVLRTDTAGLVAAALVLHRAGDLGC